VREILLNYFPYFGGTHENTSTQRTQESIPDRTADPVQRCGIRHRYNTPAVLYTCNIVFLGLMNYVLWRYISKPKLGLVEGLDRPMTRYFSFRALLVPTVFILTLAVYLVLPLLAVYIPMLIPVFMYVVKRTFRKAG
jgi:hypothetical protein